MIGFGKNWRIAVSCVSSRATARCPHRRTDLHLGANPAPLISTQPGCTRNLINMIQFTPEDCLAVFGYGGLWITDFNRGNSDW